MFHTALVSWTRLRSEKKAVALGSSDVSAIDEERRKNGMDAPGSRLSRHFATSQWCTVAELGRINAQHGGLGMVEP